MNLPTSCLAILILLICLAMNGCTPLERISKNYYAHEAPVSIYALVNVNLMSMETNSVLPQQTVLIKGERIAEIGDADVLHIPETAHIISGEGKYLLPGLIDMHVHISDDGDLLKFLKYGITTVRNMSDVPWWAKCMGFSDILSLQAKQQQSKIIGPDIYPSFRTPS